MTDPIPTDEPNNSPNRLTTKVDKIKETDPQRYIGILEGKIELMIEEIGILQRKLNQYERPARP